MFLVLIFMMFGCQPRRETIQPVRHSISESVYASGQVKARHQYQLFANVSGLVEEVLVAEGDTVTRGQTILRIASRMQKLSAENAALAAG